MVYRTRSSPWRKRLFFLKKIWQYYAVFPQKLFTSACSRRREQGNINNIVLNVIKEHLDMELSVKGYGKRKRFVFRIIVGIVKFFVKGKECVCLSFCWRCTFKSHILIWNSNLFSQFNCLFILIFTSNVYFHEILLMFTSNTFSYYCPYGILLF